MIRSRRLVVSILGIGLAVCASAVMAEQFRGRGRSRMADIAVEKTPYDGQFAFARLRHGAVQMFRGEPPWAHDYPRAERNFMRILAEITLLQPHLDSSTIVAQDDPDLYAHPIAYMSEPGYWTMDEDELAGLRQYIQKGGFVIFDDFRGEHWYNFQEQVQRLIPNARLVEIDPAHPIFHSFFDIDITETAGYYRDYGRLAFHGVFEDNDPTKRLLLVANYNHDLGELWEYSDQGFVPVDLSNDAYKYGINYVVYAMSH